MADLTPGRVALPFPAMDVDAGRAGCLRSLGAAPAALYDRFTKSVCNGILAVVWTMAAIVEEAKP